MVGLQFKLSERYVIHKTPIPLININNSRNLCDSETSANFGILDKRGKEILDALRKKITFQLFADTTPTRSGEAPRSRTSSLTANKRQRIHRTLELCAVLYGSPTISSAVGIYTAKCGLYLQHPEHCDRNVPYQNPQCLSSDLRETVFTLDLQSLVNLTSLRVEISANPIDLFADTSVQDVLSDAATPKSLSTELYKHQKQALTFMMQRERGWALDGHQRDIWKMEKDIHGGTLYQNMISGSKQARPPREFRGGLLIDAPGLGKSLSILALITSEARSEEWTAAGPVDQPVNGAKSGATLVIVPKTRKLYPAS